MNSRNQTRSSSNKRCPKCNYIRTADDLALDGECPMCGIIYVKYENRTQKENHSYPEREITPEKSSSPKTKVTGVLFLICCLVMVYFALVHKPASDAPKPTIDVPELAGNAPKPTHDVPEPTREAPEPTHDVPEPTREVPKPANDVPEPARDTPKSNSTNNTQVTLLSTTRCGYCRLAKDYLDKHDIKYIEWDVEQSEEGRNLYRQLSGRGVPIILIGDTRINGYSEEVLEQALHENIGVRP